MSRKPHGGGRDEIKTRLYQMGNMKSRSLGKSVIAGIEASGKFLWVGIKAFSRWVGSPQVKSRVAKTLSTITNGMIAGARQAPVAWRAIETKAKTTLEQRRP